jgi:sugar O-acyltransferase (sialic acid O-acetyltransferase NeuD family)
MTPIVLWGGTGQAKVLAEFLPDLGYEVVAVVDNNPEVESPVSGVPVLIGRAAFATWRSKGPEKLAGIAAIGGSKGRDRIEIGGRFRGLGVREVTVIHPRAYVARGVHLGDGGQVLANATVAAGAELGRACIVNHNAGVDHECRLGDGVHIGPGATLCGCVVVEDFAFVGAGAVVLPRVRIGRDVVVGAGAVVTRDVSEGAVVCGNPARLIQKPK